MLTEVLLERLRMRRYAGSAEAEIPGRNGKQERKPMSKIIHFLGLDVHQETVAGSFAPERNLRRCG